MSAEELFIKEHFKKFYSGKEVSGPPEMETREFGYGVFGRKISNRHLFFDSKPKLNTFLREQVPFFLSYSSALYKYPSRRPMEAKELFAADLVYEFDADDLLTDCKEKHDSWTCPKCGKTGKGRQLACDRCGAQAKLDEWFCPECLGAAKQKVFSLLEFLENDFGFTEGIAINFSGRAGYHVHVRSEAVRQLPNTARIEMIDYLTANGLNIFSHFEKEKTFFTFKGKLSEKTSWPSRIVSKLIDLLEEGDAEKIAVMSGISLPLAKKVLKQSPLVIKSIKERNTIPSIFGRISSTGESQSDKFRQSFLSTIVEKIAPIDRQTSIDLNKIVRVPDTLHGETGFVSTNLTRDSLKEYNPFDDAVVFDKGLSEKVFINKAPSFYLAGENYGPFEKEEAELPLPVAIFLLARGAASLQR